MVDSILVENGTLLTLQNDTLIHKGFIIIEGNRIRQIGEGTYQGEQSFVQKIDASGKVIMPGLINAHGHAPLSLLRGYADDLPLQDWLKSKVWPFEKRLTQERIFWGAQLAILEMLKTGTTCYTDVYYQMDEVAHVVEQSGIRAVLSCVMYGTEYEENEYIKESREFMNKWNLANNGRIRTFLGPHSVYTCTPAFLRKVSEVSHELNQPIQIHLSETEKEVSECIGKYGCTPIQLMEQIGLFEQPTLAAHCVHVTDEDMDILARNKVCVSHNPDSNLKLGSGIAPVFKMISKGITVGLGTDSAASNNNLNLMDEIRMAAMLHKGVEKDSTAITAYQALCMATKQGAKSLFSEHTHGTLQPGALADMIFIDMDAPYYYPKHNIISNFVYSGQSSDVSDVIVDGKFIVRNYQILTMDEEKIKHEIGRICAKF